MPICSSWAQESHRKRCQWAEGEVRGGRYEHPRVSFWWGRIWPSSRPRAVTGGMSKGRVVWHIMDDRSMALVLAPVNSSWVHGRPH